MRKKSNCIHIYFLLQSQNFGFFKKKISVFWSRDFQNKNKTFFFSIFRNLIKLEKNKGSFVDISSVVHFLLQFIVK